MIRAALIALMLTGCAHLDKSEQDRRADFWAWWSCGYSAPSWDACSR
ncbi:hypothetical protein [Jeongeupia chitinilytica]|nr:hypothetical protein [Jeongeupia chitinilytica]